MIATLHGRGEDEERRVKRLVYGHAICLGCERARRLTYEGAQFISIFARSTSTGTSTAASESTSATSGSMSTTSQYGMPGVNIRRMLSSVLRAEYQPRQPQLDLNE